MSEENSTPTPPRFFFLRLIPPRPTFAHDMTAEERSVMQQHVGYWTKHLQQGTAIVFGPVADPAGPYGLGIVRVADETAIGAFITNDPAICGRIGCRYEVFPMLRATVRD